MRADNVFELFKDCVHLVEITVKATCLSPGVIGRGPRGLKLSRPVKRI